MSEKKIRFLILALILLFAVAILVFIKMVSVPIESEDTKRIGLFKSEVLEEIHGMDAEQRLYEYNEREEFPEPTIESYEQRALTSLSRGEFDDLDAYLQEISQNYKNVVPGEREDLINLTWLISAYRSDLSMIKNLTKETGAEMLRSFLMPDVLAAAIIYQPISVKMDAFLSFDALLLPAVSAQDGENYQVQLSPADTSHSELGEMLLTINENSPNYHFVSINAYDCFLYGLHYRIYLVQNSSGFFQPYTLVNLDGKDRHTHNVLEIKDLVRSTGGYPGFSVDGLIAQPYYDEGMIQGEPDYPLTNQTDLVDE